MLIVPTIELLPVIYAEPTVENQPPATGRLDDGGWDWQLN